MLSWTHSAQSRPKRSIISEHHHHHENTSPMVGLAREKLWSPRVTCCQELARDSGSVLAPHPCVLGSHPCPRDPFDFPSCPNLRQVHGISVVFFLSLLCLSTARNAQELTIFLLRLASATMPSRWVLSLNVLHLVSKDQKAAACPPLREPNHHRLEDWLLIYPD